MKTVGSLSICCVVVVLLGCVPALLAQSETASLSGRVTDPQGGVVPHATVEAIQSDTKVQATTETNGEGLYYFASLRPASYRVVVTKDGFKQVIQSDVVLHVQDQLTLNFALQLGSASESVTVNAEASTVRADGSVGTVVDRQFVENIPLNGRSLQSLITLTPGVVLVPSLNNGRGSGMFSINGQRANANYFTVDGVSANVGNDPGGTGQFAQAASGALPSLTADGGTNSLVSIDALQEFKIQTSSYSAEFGRQPGGQISFVTRSGTNDFHGSIFDYVRNEAFDANDWFANRSGLPRPPERQHDFGGVFGGPLLFPWFGEGGPSIYNGRDKTFFFLSYEGLRLRLPKFALTNVPTLALRQTAPEPVRSLLNAFPLPNGRDLGNGLAEFASTYSDPSTLNAASLRIDQVIGSKLTLFGRFNKAPSRSARRLLSTAGQGNLANPVATELDLMTVTIGGTYSATSHMSDELRTNYTKNNGTVLFGLDNFGGATPSARSLLIPQQFDSPTALGGLLLFFPGSSFFASANIGASARSRQRQLNVVDNFAYSVGSHQLKFGVDYRRITPIIAPVAYSLSAIFRSQVEVINGRAASGSVLARVPVKPIYTNFSAFGQDTWKLSRRLTLSLGLRWELNPPPGETDGNIPLSVHGLENLATADLSLQGTPLWKTTYNNFAPRVGVAYQVSQAPGHETVIRGGFGVFYDVGSGEAFEDFNGNFPYQASRTLTSVNFPLDLAQVAPPPFPSLTPPYGQVVASDSNLKLPYTLHWNLAAERSLGKNQTLSASYVGAVGRRLIRQRMFDLRTINPKFTRLRVLKSEATSDYHAFQLQFQRRLSRGLQALASYTWAHAIDEASSEFGDDTLVRGNSDFDIRHNFAAALTYDIPLLRLNSVTDAILRGWSIDSRVNYQTAFPLNIVGNTIIDPFDGTIKSQRPNLIQGVPLYLQDPSRPGGRVINRAAFSPAPAGVNGSLGRNVLRGFPSWQVDMALRRQFRLTEKVKLQFRAESFNLFNHPNFGNIQTGLTDARFGEATNMLGRQLGGLNALYQVGGPRSFQFALKITF